jgi:hypothetical protein
VVGQRRTPSGRFSFASFALRSFLLAVVQVEIEWHRVHALHAHVEARADESVVELSSTRCVLCALSRTDERGADSTEHAAIGAHIRERAERRVQLWIEDELASLMEVELGIAIAQFDVDQLIRVESASEVCPLCKQS